MNDNLYFFDKEVLFEERVSLLKKSFLGIVLLSLLWFLVLKEFFEKYFLIMLWFGVFKRFYFLKDMRDVDMVNVVGLIMFVFKGSFCEKFKNVFGWLFFFLICYVVD